MRRFSIPLSILILLWASHATALTIPGFENARPLDNQSLEVGGGFSFGDDTLVGFGTTRLGLFPDLEAFVRAGIVYLQKPEEAGFELEGGAKFRFLRQKDTADAVDLAFMVSGSLLKTGDLFVFGVDPTVVASHHFELGSGLDFFLGIQIGLAATFFDVDGGESDSDLGLIGSLSAGVEVIESVRILVEGRIRDDQQRLGLAVTSTF